VVITPGSGLTGGQFQVVAAATPGAARTATVTVTNGPVTKTMTVKQDAAKLTTSPSSSWSADWEGESVAVQVTASIGLWSLDRTNLPDWLTVVADQNRVSGDRMVVQAARNEGPARAFDLVVKAGELSKVVTVKQQAGAAASISLSKTSWSAPAVTGSLAIAVSTNRAQWSAWVDQSWLHLSRTDGHNGAVLVLGVDSNPASAARVGYVTVSAGGVSKSVKVTQAAGPAQVTVAWRDGPTLWNIDNTVEFDTGLAALGVLSVSDDASWLKVEAGSAVGLVRLTATANTGSVRHGLVTLKKGSATVGTFVVVQDGSRDLSAGSDKWSVSGSGGEVSRKVTDALWFAFGEDQWTATTWDSSWLSVSEGPASSGTNMTIVADRNTTGVARTAWVYVQTTSNGMWITVTQAK
jgi:hypothetical protein